MTTALYRRYRPDTFAQVIGQTHVTDPLCAALRADRVTHAYLFSGPRGCGKTTSARILARCLNCAEGPTDTPCGKCESCRELATGGPGSLDVVEIDAASHGGVDDARDLRERATFAPVRDRYKVFIVDEAHMVTPQAFNALLKLVEEPPEHVKFVFATTEPDKVLGTIRSRTHHYPFRLVPPDVLEPYLRDLCAQEGIGVGEGVLPLVIRAGGGSVRDSLSVLDQVMAGAIDSRLDYERVVALLGYTDSALLDQTVDALAGGDGAAAYRVIERMVDSGHDPRRFVEDFLQRLRDLLILSVAGDGARDVLASTPADQMERMVVQARNWGPQGLARAAELTDKALRAMVGATSPRLQLELLIGRILVAPSPVVTGGPGDVSSRPVPDMVGMVGGGAPREAAPGRYGAAEAKADLERRRREREGARGASAIAVSQSLPESAPAPVLERSLGATSVEASAPSGERPGWTDIVASRPARTSSREEWPEVAVPNASAADAGARAVEVPPPSTADGSSTADAPSTADGSEAEHSWSDVVPASPARVERGEAPASAPIDPASGGSAATPVEEVRHEAAPAGRASGAEADMLRQRWPEVLARLSQISRVAWSLLQTNAQLGGIEAGTVVLLLPTEGLVNNFVNGGRAPAIEQAIAEALGLTLRVRAQVGQASGGASVTTPGAPAAEVVTPFVPEGGGSDPAAPSGRSERGAARVEVPPERTAPPGTGATTGPAPGTSAWPEVAVPPAAAEHGFADVVAEFPDGELPAADVAVSRSVTAEVSGGPAAGAEEAHVTPVPDAVPEVAWPEVVAPPAPEPVSGPVAPEPAVPTPPREVREADPGVDALPADPVRDARNERGGRPRGTEEPTAPRVAAADDDSASIDDDTIDTSTRIGVAAVLEVLGGTIIDTKVDEGAW